MNEACPMAVRSVHRGESKNSTKFVHTKKNLASVHMCILFVDYRVQLCITLVNISSISMVKHTYSKDDIVINMNTK